MKRNRTLLVSIIALAAILFLAAVASQLTNSGVLWNRSLSDMAAQPKFKSQSENPFFADRRAMRMRIPGATARGEWSANPLARDGAVAGEWAATIPIPVDEGIMQRGRQNYIIFCAPCHGQTGGGDSVTAQRANQLKEDAWTPPAVLRNATVLQQPPGQIYNTIAHGIRTMPAHGPQIVPEDRWAIVAYVKTLQRS